jgi:hypothetical protein
MILCHLLSIHLPSWNEMLNVKPTSRKKLTRDLNSDGGSVDKLWDHFEGNIPRRIMDICIPHKMTSSRYNLPWFNRSLWRQTRTIQRFYNKAKSHTLDWILCSQKTSAKEFEVREAYISDFLGDAIEENTKRSNFGHISNLNNWYRV